MEDNNSFLLLLSAHQNDETFSPVIFNILKEPMLIPKNRKKRTLFYATFQCKRVFFSKKTNKIF